MTKRVYVCEAHVDLALEYAAEETLEPPLFEKVNPVHSLSTTCEYCNNVAIYMVSNMHSHT